MPKRFVISIFVLVAGALVFSPRTRTQTAINESVARQPGAIYDFDVKGETPAPAPKRDLSGIWEPARGPGDGVQANGAKAMPSDGKHDPPYTAEGKAMLDAHKPTFGVRMVPSALTNDPMPGCDPQGFPRIVLHNFRTSEIVQTPNQILFLYEFNKKWRVIWTDGRALPKDPEQPRWTAKDPPEARWWGYSTGKWVDDYTFVAESNGFDDRTWLDNAGLPHSDALQVEETYHRVDAKHVEMSVKITDPKVYTTSWMALDKLRLRLQAPDFDIHEMECSPTETAEYNKFFAEPAAGIGGK